MLVTHRADNLWEVACVYGPCKSVVCNTGATETSFEACFNAIENRLEKEEPELLQ